MSTPSKQDVQLHELTQGAFLFCSPQGNILFGCPPEILKRILQSHLPMPDTIVVPEKLQHIHSSQSSLEFPFYHFLFVQRGLDRGRCFNVVAYPAQCEGLAELLRVTVVGPTGKEMVSAGLPAHLAKEIYQETTYLCLKNPNNGNRPFAIKEMVNFHPLSPGGRHLLYAAQDNMAELKIERLDGARFRVLYGEDAYDIDMTVTAEQVPNYKLNHQPFDKSAGKFLVTILGRSNGFDPNDPANGYLINVDGKVALWDCPAYLHQHLKHLKLAPKDIDAFILSHVHEDHIDITESLRDSPFELYTTPEIYYSLLVKLSSVMSCSIEEAKQYHVWHPIDADNPGMEIIGAQWEFFHSVHAIPALGARISKEVGGRPGLLHISRRRYDRMMSLLTGKETLALMDVGGGAIHGDYRDYLEYKGHMAYMHTGIMPEDLPERHELVTSGQVLNVLE